jgi:hypothetical protein
MKTKREHETERRRGHTPIEAVYRPDLEDLAAVLGRDADVRSHVERIAPLC